MCIDCGGICTVLSRMIGDYHREFPAASHDTEDWRPKYVPMDVQNAPKAAIDPAGLADMLEHVEGIGMSRLEFATELSRRSGLGEQVENWIHGRIPNGWARKLILINAEDIVREHGAHPVMSMQEAA